MKYRAGTAGLAGIGFPDGEPHWYCVCGGWRFDAKPMPRAATGNNQRAAERSFGAHRGK